eukprot:g1986.t1 g1986   contig11:471546-472466(-)
MDLRLVTIFSYPRKVGVRQKEMTTITAIMAIKKRKNTKTIRLKSQPRRYFVKMHTVRTKDHKSNKFYMKQVKQKIPMTQNPFDGWVGSTIKCSICQRIRPIRSTPFLCLSLPIANNPPSHVRLEDFILSELGGFATAERVSDVECVSCAIVKKVQELEEELLLLTDAISSIQKRNKGVGVKANEAASIQSLVLESQQLQYTISNLRASDPDADDEDREDHGDGDGDVAIGFELLQATIKSCPRLAPIRGNALKATLMMRPPKVLCIHVQRRHFDVRCQRMAKLNRRVAFPRSVGCFRLLCICRELF